MLYLLMEVLGDNIQRDEAKRNAHLRAFSPIIIIEDHIYRLLFTHEGADKILDYYRASKGAFLCIQKNKRILHYGYIIKQSL